MDQLRMFRLAVEAVNVQCVHVPGQGWRLSVGARRQDESWPEAGRDEYCNLSTDELLDVLLEVLPRLLGAA